MRHEVIFKGQKQLNVNDYTNSAETTYLDGRTYLYVVRQGRTRNEVMI